MTTRHKATAATLRITQVHSIIGNQERVKRVVTDGLGLGRIGRSVVLPDNSYTRGMIAKAAHIVTFEEVAAQAPAARPAPAVRVPEAVDKLVESVVAAGDKAPRKKKAVEGDAADRPAKAPARAPRTRAAAKDEE
ncbi:MAG: 50S ribosomal protein L30 [Thermoanaerobaculaceae bacterium]|nr:50S ribosomal protein L30 [Thermoanaerobaculaceae bacterium]